MSTKPEFQFSQLCVEPFWSSELQFMIKLVDFKDGPTGCHLRVLECADIVWTYIILAYDIFSNPSIFGW